MTRPMARGRSARPLLLASMTRRGPVFASARVPLPASLGVARCSPLAHLRDTRSRGHPCMVGPGFARTIRFQGELRLPKEQSMTNIPIRRCRAVLPPGVAAGWWCRCDSGGRGWFGGAAGVGCRCGFSRGCGAQAVRAAERGRPARVHRTHQGGEPGQGWVAAGTDSAARPDGGLDLVVALVRVVSGPDRSPRGCRRPNWCAHRLADQDLRGPVRPGHVDLDPRVLRLDTGGLHPQVEHAAGEGLRPVDRVVDAISPRRLAD